MSDNTRDLAIRAPKTGPWIIGYAATLGLSFSLFSLGVVTDPKVGALVWIPIAICTAMMVWTSWRRHRLLGTVSAAVRSFWRRFVLSASFMFGSFCLLAFAQMVGKWGPDAEYVIAILPNIGFLGMIWAVHQYLLDETDEYLRTRAIRQVLIASFVTLTVSMIWATLATAKVLGNGYTGMVLLIWFAGLGVGRLYNEVRP
jgi:hypothetical protein